MPLTIHVCAFLLFLCSTTSCFGTQYKDFHSHTSTCGDVEFGYRFGINGSGCGDPDFQLQSCDYESHTLINNGGIGNQYHILESSFLVDSSTYKILVIVKDNVWDGKCNLSGNYSQFQTSGSRFDVLDTYTNITLWKPCHQVAENISGVPVSYNLSLCGSDWYYSLDPHLNLEGTFCKVFQLPIKQNFSRQPIDNKTLLAQGFEVTWNVDRSEKKRCEATSEKTLLFSMERSCSF